jgi:hypothetical protein
MVIMMFVCLWFCLEERGKDQFWKSPILYFSFLKVRASFLPSFPPLNGISWKMRKLFCLHRLEEGFGKSLFCPLLCFAEIKESTTHGQNLKEDKNRYKFFMIYIYMGDKFFFICLIF